MILLLYYCRIYYNYTTYCMYNINTNFLIVGLHFFSIILISARSQGALYPYLRLCTDIIIQPVVSSASARPAKLPFQLGGSAGMYTPSYICPASYVLVSCPRARPSATAAYGSQVYRRRPRACGTTACVVVPQLKLIIP